MAERIGIIGSGNMGRTVGTRLAQVGHLVFFGARDIEKAAAAAQQARSETKAGSIDEAARFGDLLLWTTRETDPAKVLADPMLLESKVLIDLNNRDFQNEARTGAWFDKAIAESLQENVSNAEVVKAFNTIPMEDFDIDPAALRSVGATTFLAGRSRPAKERVGSVAESLGFKPVDLGDGVAALRAAEALGDAIRLLFIDGGRSVRTHLAVVELPEATLNTIAKRQPSGYA